MSTNPYRAPEAEVDPLEGEPIIEARPVESAQSIRRRSNDAELNVRAFMVFDVLLIGWALLVALFSLTATPTQPDEQLGHLVLGWLSALCVPGAVISAALLFRLHPFGRVTQSVLCILLSAAVSSQSIVAGVVSLLLYGATCWWVLWSRDSRPVFTMHYRNVIVPRTTREARTGEWLWRLCVVGMLHIPTFVVFYEVFRPAES